MRGIISTTQNPSFVELPDTLGGQGALFVAKNWPDGIDTSTHFTSISSAMTQAATMSPSQAAPVLIIVYPGTYSEAIVLVSNVHIFGYTKDSVTIAGPVTWTPGVGINAGQIANPELVDIVLLNFSPAASISYDGTTKKGMGVSSFDFRNVSIKCNLTFNGWPSATQHLQAWNTIITGTLSVTSGNTNFYAGSFQGVSSFLESTFLDILACDIENAVTLGGVTAASISGCDLQANINVGSGTMLTVTGGRVDAAAVLNSGSWWCGRF